MYLNRILRDRRGSAAVEFALIVPVIMLLYYGMAEATQVLLANRRASFIATGVGDLTAQRPQWSKAQIDDVFNISAAALKPFPVTGLGIRLVSIQTDANAVPKVIWTEQRGSFPAPTDLSTVEKTANQAIIRAETIYRFESPIGRIFPDAFTFKHKKDFRPRSEVAVVLLN
jgi:Flp pilus assembly protein TadG